MLRPTRNLCFLKKRAPLVVERRAVGLDRVGDLLARALVPLDVLDRALEEVEAHQRRLAALPADDHLGAGLRLEQLPDVGLEQLVGHPEPAAGVEHLLREEEAVLAVEVADRARRLGQQVERSSLHHQPRMTTTVSAIRPIPPRASRRWRLSNTVRPPNSCPSACISRRC